MSTQYLEFAIGLFGVCLPMSMVGCTIAVLSVGWLRDPADQPAEFRFIVTKVRSWVSERSSVRSPDLVGIGAAIVFWGPANGGLLYVPVYWLHDLTVMLLLIAYIVVQALWLLRIYRAIVRSRTGSRVD